jgi:diketogulonate reductase-like aldo/keto reductase
MVSSLCFRWVNLYRYVEEKHGVTPAQAVLRWQGWQNPKP